MKIALIADSFEKVKGGIEKQAEILFRLLSTSSHQVVFVEYNNLNRLIFSKNDVIVIEGIHRLKLFKILFYRKSCYNIIFTHGSFFTWTKHPNISVKGKGTNYLRIKRIFDLFFMKRILSKFDLIVTLSESESKDLLKLFKIAPQKVYALGNFSDEPRMSGMQDTAIDLPNSDYVCYVGRLDERKNLIELLKATAYQNLHLVIAGQDQGMLIKLLDYCKVNNFKHFHYEGLVDESAKFKIIQNSRFAAVPSLFEGLPTFAIEALKSKKNVIVTQNCYMDPHPCVIFTGPNWEDISVAIEKARLKTGCDGGYESNQHVFERFIKIVDGHASENDKITQFS
ncbi:MAG: glycosyltransferase family 4 protein [Thermoplasmatales archaeon]